MIHFSCGHRSKFRLAHTSVETISDLETTPCKRCCTNPDAWDRWHRGLQAIETLRIERERHWDALYI